MTEKKVEIHRGLVGVYFDRSKTTRIDGKQGILEYRGYDIHDLAEKSTFEETSYLLLHGELPTKTQLSEFDKTLKNSREIPDGALDIINSIKDSHPMDVLRTAVSSLSSFDPETSDKSLEATLRKGIRLTAQVPTIVMAHNAIRNGKNPIKPNNNLSHAANFLYMMNGKPPSDLVSNLMDKDFIVHADHGSNASAFAARVSAGTQADLHSAITTGISVLSGPSHGGAAENVMNMVKDVGSPDNAKNYVESLLKSKQRVMGFGHRVYRSEDPRAKHLENGVQMLSKEKGDPSWYEILIAVKDAMEPYRKKGINANVDFYAGVIYHLLGIPTDLFVPIFAVGRIPGWTIQVLEQYENNILLRPLLHYNGEESRPYINIDSR
ncbi:MAG: citrate/2-methylcitrate synthase [Dehalococcoidia bacterium]|jgi:citrate synthase|nr:citrate/2-methylcitrate synthase [Dehalococcoidia bacterium]HJN58554.1 citrate/2-methylcitrate synthase [Dehalococcoidia bacterium]